MISPPANAAPARPAMGQSGWTGRSRKSRSPRPPGHTPQGSPSLPQLSSRAASTASQGKTQVDSRPLNTEAVARFVAAHGEKRWPSMGTFDGRLREDSHGRRHQARPSGTPTPDVGSRTLAWSLSPSGCAASGAGKRPATYDGLECHRHREQPCPRPPTRTHRSAAVRTKPRSPDADYTRMALGRMVQAADPRFLCLAVSETHPGTQTSYAQPTGQCSSACDLPVIHRGTRVPLAHPRPGVPTQFPWGDPRSIGATCG